MEASGFASSVESSAFTGKSSAATCAGNDVLCLSSPLSKFKPLFAGVLDEGDLYAVSDGWAIDSRTSFVVGLKNCSSYVSCLLDSAIGARRPAGRTGSLATAVVGRTGSAVAVAVAVASLVMANLICCTSSSVYALTMVYLSFFCPW